MALISSLRPLRAGLQFLLLVLLAADLGACKAKYPRCDGDADCAVHNEICVQGQCQECATATQCESKYPGEKRVCNNGRCDRASECATDAQCKTDGRDLVCRHGVCVPECTRDGECPAGRKCVSQRCAASCAADVDCPSDGVCVDGVCTDAATAERLGHHSCRPTRAGDVVALPSVQFSFNQSDLDADAKAALEHTAACLRQAPTLKVIVEGHCDDRGTQEYNLALGERRGQSVLKYLGSLGANAERLEVVSKGENEPLCSEATDACFAQNRRVQFIQHAR